MKLQIAFSRHSVKSSNFYRVLPVQLLNSSVANFSAEKSEQQLHWTGRTWLQVTAHKHQTSHTWPTRPPVIVYISTTIRALILKQNEDHEHFYSQLSPAGGRKCRGIKNPRKYLQAPAMFAFYVQCRSDSCRALITSSGSYHHLFRCLSDIFASTFLFCT